MKRIRSWGVPVLLICLWTINEAFSRFSTIQTSNAGGQIFHGITIITTLMLLLLIGDILGQQEFNLTQFVKYWLYTIGLALLIVVSTWLFLNQFKVQNLYNALLPVTRNTIPLATAIILGSLLLPWLKQHLAPAPNVWLVALITPLAISIIFGRDPFGLLNGRSVTFYLLIMIIGSIATDLIISKRQLIVSLVSWGIVDLLLITSMPKISLLVHHSLITAGRFTTVTSFVMVLVALNSYLLARPLLANLQTTAYPTIYFWLSVAIIINDPLSLRNINHLTSNSNKVIQTCFLLLTGIIIVACALLLPLLVKWGQHYTNLDQRLNRLFSTNSAQTPQEQLVTISHKVKRSLIARWPLFLALLMSYVLADISIYYMKNDSLFVKQSMLWLTAILVFLIFKGLQALTNRYWVSLFTTLLFMVIWTVANVQKMQLRDEPILPSDLSMIDDLDSLLKMIDYHLLIYVGIAIVLVIIVMVILEHFQQAQRLSWGWRILWLVLAVVTFASSNYWNHHNSRMQTLLTGLDDQPHFIHQAVGAKQNGPTVQFLNNVDITIMEKPHGYSAATMKRISQRYQRQANKINVHRTNQLKDQTVIFNLSESFANPNRVPGVSLKNNPIPQIQQIKKQTTSGIMISSGYGGGTADMEYMTLTGFAMCNFAQTLSTPYTQLVPYLKHNPTIVQSFKYAAAIHPYSKKFYDRGTDYPKFGFNHFSYLGNKKYPIKHQKKIDRNTYLSDQTAYANTLDQLTTHHGPQFINLVTMQNHLPYNNLYNGIQRFRAKVGNGTNANQVENYAMGIHYTDQAVAKFIKKINHINRPITLVFYGDHLPGIYRNSMKKDGLKLHETDYFIYSNPAARRMGAKRLTTSTHFVGPNDFIAMVAEQTNSKVTPYQALLTLLYHRLPAYALSTQQNGTNSFNSAPEYVNQQGKVVSYKSFTKEQKQLWHDYQLVQYDITAGHHYLLKTNMIK